MATIVDMVDAGGVQMQRLDSPPKMNVILLFVLTFVTIGIFAPVWFLRRRDWLNRLSAARKLGSGLPMFVAIIYGIAAIMFFTLDETAYEFGEGIGNIISLVGGVCIVVLAFQVRRILIQHYDDKLDIHIGFSGLGTLLFTIFYLQHKINRLPLSAEPSGDLDKGEEPAPTTSPV